jgi:molybdenum cofactor biosynthesis enzyme MoaA
MPDEVNVSNLDLFPLRGQDAFVEAVNREGVRQIVFTGTVTDPSLYRHQGRLLAHLRERIHGRAQFSIHTNGVLALARMDELKQYDRACLSFPSFDPDTYYKMMGSRRVPDLAAIVLAARIPVKVSCIVNEHNVGELDAFLARCQAIGVRRVVLRRLFGETRAWNVLPGRVPTGRFKGNPVYDLNGMEVTYWDFDEAGMRSLNLFADGTLGTSYLITRTPELRQAG